MCIQLQELDATLGSFFILLDSTGVDYEVVLTADHGGNDIPEREVDAGLPDAQRVQVALAPAIVGKDIATKLGIAKPTLFGDIPNGDIYIARDLTPAQRKAVQAEAIARYKAAPQVAEVFTAAQILATKSPTGDPVKWTLLQRPRASYKAGRSGDLIVFLKARVTPIPDPTKGYVATHGSPYDYDRRVPILFWRKGMARFEHPAGIETVDIAPTLARQIGLTLTGPKMDGKCLDLANGGGTVPVKLPLEGRCLCDRVRVHVAAAPFLTMACHCIGCQRLTASAFSLSVAVPREGFSVEGETVIGALHGAHRHRYCAHCLNWLYTEPDGLDWLVNVRTSLFDEKDGLDPLIEVWTNEKLAWVATPAIHSFATHPEEDAYPALMKEFAARA